MRAAVDDVPLDVAGTTALRPPEHAASPNALSTTKKPRASRCNVNLQGQAGEVASSRSPNRPRRIAGYTSERAGTHAHAAKCERIRTLGFLRTRLVERIARAARFPVTLIVAPAGFGKSTALRDYLVTSRIDAARYDIQRGDATLAGFVRGLSRALEPLAPTALAAYPAMQARVLASDDPIDELAIWFGEHLRKVVGTIVLDDFHHAHPDAVALFVRLVESTWERISWIVASRSDVGIPVATWIGTGRMDLPIGEDVLRFTPEETRALADDDTANDDIEALRELTGGWPIALAIALRTQTHAADLRAATAGTRDLVYRYLAEAVFAGLRPDQRAFLLRTCVLPAFDRAIAERLGASPEQFDDLRRAVTFIAEIAPQHYRYHDLFREFLEAELARSGEAAERAALASAAALCEGRDEIALALELWTRAHDAAAIVRLLNAHGLLLVDRGETEIVTAAIDALPPARRAQDATVLGLRGTIDAARGRFDLAEPLLRAAIARATESDLRLALVHRYALELVRAGRDAIAVLEPDALSAATPHAFRAPLLATLATAYAVAGRLADAEHAATLAIARLEPAPDAVRARVYQQAAYVAQFGSDRDRVRTYAETAVELALAGGLYELAARAYSALYTVVGDAGEDPIPSLAILDRMRECARKGGSRQVRAYATMVAYAVEVERGDATALETLAAELEREGDDVLPSVRDAALLPALALHAAASADFSRAYALLAASPERQREVDRRALRYAEVGLYALAAGERSAGDEAISSARTLLDETPATGKRGVRTLLVLALAELVRGRGTAAHRDLTDAERLVTPEMRRLRAFAHAVRTRYRGAIDGSGDLAAALERLRAEHGGGFAQLIASLPIGSDGAPGYGALTPTERDVLAHLIGGATSKEIAARTNRSSQTIDAHIKSICRKLECSGRREAVAIAVRSGWFAG